MLVIDKMLCRHHKMSMPSIETFVVYFDQLSGAVRTQNLVEMMAVQSVEKKLHLKLHLTTSSLEHQTLNCAVDST